MSEVVQTKDKRETNLRRRALRNRHARGAPTAPAPHAERRAKRNRICKQTSKMAKHASCEQLTCPCYEHGYERTSSLKTRATFASFRRKG